MKNLGDLSSCPVIITIFFQFLHLSWYNSNFFPNLLWIVKITTSYNVNSRAETMIICCVKYSEWKKNCQPLQSFTPSNVLAITEICVLYTKAYRKFNDVDCKQIYASCLNREYCNLFFLDFSTYLEIIGRDSLFGKPLSFQWKA